MTEQTTMRWGACCGHPELEKRLRILSVSSGKGMYGE